MLGHSMGAEVTLYAAAALGNQLKGASIWSVYVPTVAKISVQFSEMEASSEFEKIYSPINIHHAKGYRSSRIRWTPPFQKIARLF